MTGAISDIYGAQDGLALAALVKQGEVSASEVIEEAISRAEAVDGTLNFLTYKAYEEGRAMAADPNLPDGPFKGVPWLVKEIATDWEGLQNTNACPFFKDIVSTTDCERVTRIKKAGFVLLGKSNSPEAGWALSTEPKMYGATVNPWDTTRTPGGSSGGSAAAVTARVLPLAEASDGGGSIRTPACHSGLVGLKPARGRISLAPGADFWYGGVTFLCVSRSVRDTAAFFDAVGGPLPGDAYFARMPEDPYLGEVGQDPGRLSVAIVTASPDGCTPVDADVREGIESTGKLLESLGHRVTPEAVPYDFWTLYNTYTRIGAVGTAAWFDGFAGLVGHSVRQDETENLYWTTIQKGRAIPGVEHHNDIEALRVMCRDIVGRMAAYDAWLMPVVPMVPRKIGFYDMSLDVDDYNATIMGPDCAFTAPFNATGLPAISLPLHWTAGGLPVGAQFVGRDLDEGLLLRLAGQLEQAQPWADRLPPINAGA